jgi:hypothetical protein
MDNFGATSSAPGLPRAVIAIAVALAASGCYTFTTFRTGSPTPGVGVRVTIGREAAPGLADQLGPGLSAL